MKTNEMLKWQIDRCDIEIKVAQERIEDMKHWINRELEEVGMNSLAGQNIAKFGAELQKAIEELRAAEKMKATLETIAKYSDDIEH